MKPLHPIRKLLLASALGFFLTTITLIFPRSHPSPVLSGRDTLFSPDELRKYDGSDPNLPIYLALDGLVYDVSAGRQFYIPGGPYHDLAGTDASTPLHLAGGEIIRRKYPVIGRLP